MLIRRLNLNAVKRVFEASCNVASCSSLKNTRMLHPLRGLNCYCSLTTYLLNRKPPVSIARFFPVNQINTYRRFHKVRLSGLPRNVTQDMLHEHFSQFGYVLAAHLVRDDHTLEPKGTAYIAYSEKEAFDKAIECPLHMINEQPVIACALNQVSFIVKGLPSSTSEETLRNHFSAYGHLDGCYIKRDPVKGNTGVFYFADQNEIDQNFAMRTHLIDGKQVEVNQRFPKQLTLYVGKLSPSTTEKMLHEFYSQFGALMRAEVIYDRYTGETRCFGFVTFSSLQGLDKATKCWPHVIDGREVDVQYDTKEFTLFLSQLPQGSTEKSVKKHFEQFGPVFDFRMARERQTNRLLNFGWLTYLTQEGVDKVLAACPHLLEGKLLGVSKAGKVVHDLCTLFVNRLSLRTTNDMLYETFSKFGSLTRYEVKYHDSGKSKQYGFVAFSSPDETSNALCGGPYVIDGRQITVTLKRERKKGSNFTSYQNQSSGSH